MSDSENFYALDAEALRRGKLKHSCGGVLEGKFYRGLGIKPELRLASITCPKCGAFAKWDYDGSNTEQVGNPLDLEVKLGDSPNGDANAVC